MKRPQPRQITLISLQRAVVKGRKKETASWPRTVDAHVDKSVARAAEERRHTRAKCNERSASSTVVQPWQQQQVKEHRGHQRRAAAATHGPWSSPAYGGYKTDPVLRLFRHLLANRVLIVASVSLTHGSTAGSPEAAALGTCEVTSPVMRCSI